MAQLPGNYKSVTQRFEKLLQFQMDRLADTPEQLNKAMQYSLLAGGKRLRPYLVYTVGEMLNIPASSLDAAAMAIECIHTYSLIHDDLPAMDDDDMRRGNSTCHIVFDEATAILAGDALQSLAFQLLATHPMPADYESKRIDLVENLAIACGSAGMCGGQSIDITLTGKEVRSIDQLVDMHNRKTGALIGSAITLPCQLSNELSEQNTANLTAYAAKIGLLYQVKDDILDVTMSTRMMGKPKGSDEKKQKNTFVSILGLEEAQFYLDRLKREALHHLRALPYNTQSLQDFTDYLVSREH
jgi:farnesyl diphosphate synthase